MDRHTDLVGVDESVTLGDVPRRPGWPWLWGRDDGTDS